MGPFASPKPGTVGAALPSEADLVGQLRSGLSWLDVQPVAVKLLGPLSFSAGVVFGMGEDIVSSVVELADLVKTSVLADLYDRAWGGAANGAGFSLTDPIRMLVKTIGGDWLREEAREARDQREALIEAIRAIFEDPGEFFGAIKDEYVEKWEKFERLNAQTSISARFEAGRLFGEILLAVLGLLAGGAGLAKLGAKLGGKFAKLGRKLERAAAGLKRRKGRGAASSERARESLPSSTRASSTNELAAVDEPAKANSAVPAKGTTYTPLNGPGPLGEKVGSTFRSGTYTELTTTEPTTLYRVWGGKSAEIGPYWTRTPPSGPVQSVIDSALDPAWGNTATNVTKIQVPPGVKIYEGVAASQRGLVGGGSQVFVPKVDPGWIVR
jgi:hypothetical protein